MRYLVFIFAILSTNYSSFAHADLCSGIVPRSIVYFARPISNYNTHQDRRDLEVLKQLGFIVLDPNSPEHTREYEAHGMPYFESLVQKADMLFFRGLADNSIPAGVAKEIRAMQAKNGIVIEFPSAISRRTLSVEETREFLRDSGVR